MGKHFKGGLFATAFVFVMSSCLAVVPSLVSAQPAGASSQVPLNIADEYGALWSCAFNPYVATSSPFSLGVTYETLDFVDSLENGKVTPWLATAYAWSNDNKTLTFTIRSGVKFTNGTLLTPADVVYSFEIMKQFPALDSNAVWSVLSSVTTKGSDQVVFNFSTAAVPYFYYVADQTPIVPESIWSKIKNPVTDPITDPIGTGGYVVSKCTGENIQWTANPNYWNKGLAQVKTVNMPAFLSNNTCNEYLATGQSQWGSQFIPDVTTYYVDKKAGNKYWYPPIAHVALFPNLKIAPLNNVDVREAISYAIDRPKVSSIGEYGYEPAASQVGVDTPTFSSWVSSAAVNTVGTAYDPAKSKKLLEEAGYKLVNGVFTKDGKALSLTITTNGGYSDWVADMQVAASELTAVGIQTTVATPAANTFDSDLYTGKFQLAYCWETGGPTPYFEMRQWLYSKNSAPIGQAASTNWERYDNPAVDKLLNEYGATTSSSVQHTIVNELQNVMVTQYPVIPVLESVDWFQYNESEFTNFPTPSDPYAQPSQYIEPDWGYVLDNLKPT